MVRFPAAWSTQASSDNCTLGTQRRAASAPSTSSSPRIEQSEEQDQSDDDKDGEEAAPGDKGDNVGKNQFDGVEIGLTKRQKLERRRRRGSLRRRESQPTVPWCRALLRVFL